MNRREFLKILSLSSLIPLAKLPAQFNNKSQEKDLPNIIILLFDTLSARHISLYGYDRETMPNLNKFADKATVFHKHYSTANFTTPATASLLTGTIPWTHRAMHMHGMMQDRFTNRNLFTLFSQQGYTNAAFSQNALVSILLYQMRQNLHSWHIPNEHRIIGKPVSDIFFQDDYGVAFPIERTATRISYKYPSLLLGSFALNKFWNQKNSILQKNNKDEYPRGLPYSFEYYFKLDETLDRSIDQIASLPQPFLAYHHMLPPHDPYCPTTDFIGIFNEDNLETPEKEFHFFGKPEHSDPFFLNNQRKEYDEFIANVDDQFGRFIDSLAERKQLDNTIFIFTSDHGEMFERGIYQHTTPALFAPLLHIPLLIHTPGQQAREDVFTNTSSIDILPTLLHLSGQIIPDWIEGQVLPPWGNANISRSLFALEAKSNSKFGPLVKASASIIKENYRMSHYFGYRDYQNEFELYNLSTDPEEMRNLYQTIPISGILESELLKKLAEVNEPFI